MYQRRVRTVERTLSGGFLAISLASSVATLTCSPAGATRLIDVRRERFLGREDAAGQRDLDAERAGADEIQQPPVTRAAEATRCLGDLEFRAGFGDDEIAVERDIDRHAEHVAVHGGHDRLPVHRACQDIAGAGALARRAAEPLEFLTAAQLPLLHVGAAGERAAGTAQDRDERRRGRCRTAASERPVRAPRRR